MSAFNDFGRRIPSGAVEILRDILPRSVNLQNVIINFCTLLMASGSRVEAFLPENGVGEGSVLHQRMRSPSKTKKHRTKLRQNGVGTFVFLVLGGSGQERVIADFEVSNRILIPADPRQMTDAQRTQSTVR